LTIADFSILEAEIEVDETDIPTVQLGQRAEITIDALPDRQYTGLVTEIGNSPIQPTAGAAQQEATNFLVVVTLDDNVPGVRPGFTCTAEITTATRTDALAVPIQATTVREVTVDPAGNILPPAPPSGSGVLSTSASAATTDGSGTREEREGVFILRQGRVHFTPVVTGIAGERYFEALTGLNEGDLVVTGPFEVVRNLANGDAVVASDGDAR
jgi:HlyD family secretion protein